MQHSRIASWVLASLVLLPGLADAAPSASAAPPKKAGKAAHLAPPPAAARLAFGASIGSPTNGKLLGGAHLAEAPHLRIYPVYANADVRWGVEPLVSLIDRAARSVRKQFPDAVLSVGHLSKSGGGELDRHASHESGRDADIGFYVKNHAGKPIYADHMVAFRGDGTAQSWPGAEFDDARNWALVSSMLGDGRTHITHIFVASPLRARLLKYAERVGASPAIRARAAEVLAQPKGSLPHDDHFHVRIGCPANMGQCIEQPLAKHRPSPGHAGQATAHATPAPGHTAQRPAASHEAPKSQAAGKAPTAKSDDDKNEPSVPSLAPDVPGLDSAVIPAPLAVPRSTWGTNKDPLPPLQAPKSAPIDDPDGVLDQH